MSLSLAKADLKKKKTVIFILGYARFFRHSYQTPSPSGTNCLQDLMIQNLTRVFDRNLYSLTLTRPEPKLVKCWDFTIGNIQTAKTASDH